MRNNTHISKGMWVMLTKARTIMQERTISPPFVMPYMGMQGSFHDTCRMTSGGFLYSNCRSGVTLLLHMLFSWYSHCLPYPWRGEVAFLQDDLAISFSCSLLTIIFKLFAHFILSNLTVIFCIIDGGCFNSILCAFILLQALLHDWLLVEKYPISLCCAHDVPMISFSWSFHVGLKHFSWLWCPPAWRCINIVGWSYIFPLSLSIHH